MDTKLIDWSKTILLSHTITPRLLNAITKENENMIHLGYGSRHYNMGQSTYDFLDHMLRINIRKRNLVELYEVVEDILNDMDSDLRSMLEERFFGKKCVDKLMPKMNIRTAYRHYSKALTTFSKELLRRGYDSEMLDEMFGEDRVISLILKRVQNHAIVFRHDDEEEACTTRSEATLSAPTINATFSVKVDGIMPAIIDKMESRSERVLGA